MTLDEQIKYLTKGCVDVVRAADLRTKLERASQQSRPLVVKVGFDPTSPDLHLGHTVLIRKMKHFQDCGHSVIFVVGDFTALIGDPTGRSKTRPPLTREQIAENAETYKNQVFKLLDPEKTIVDFNSRWLGALSGEEWIRLTARYNVAQMLERRDFRKRYDKGQPIAIHEFLYPLAQAYDSIFLKADVELGGTDQLFNLNVGRDIMPSFNLEAQIVMTVPLLVGLDGAEKMNKSTGNYVGITEPPVEMFGKVMSISDELMWTYYKCLTDDSVADIESVKARVNGGILHPKDAKVDLAKRIVTDFHTVAEAEGAATEFERVHSRGEQPSDMPEFSFNLDSDWKPLNRMMVDLSLANSASDGTRKISSGAVLIDGEKISDRHWKPVPGDYVLQVGRHFARLMVK